MQSDCETSLGIIYVSDARRFVITMKYGIPHKDRARSEDLEKLGIRGQKCKWAMVIFAPLVSAPHAKETLG